MTSTPAYRPAMVPGGMQPPSYQQAGQKPGGLVHMPSSLPELTAKLHNSSYSVAGMTMVDILNHFFGVLILGGDRTALPPTDAMLRLLDEFVVNPFPGRDGGHQGPTALEVLRFINCFRKYLESSSDKNVKLCVFDAIFGTDVVDIIESSIDSTFQHHLLVKLISLGISYQNKNVLEVASFWMMRYPQQSRFLMKDVYCSFCELLPSVSQPLEQVAMVTPPFASQMTIAATHMYPLFNEDAPMVVQKPPLKLLALVSTWIRSNPETLFSVHSTNTSLPLRRGPTKPSTGLSALLPVQGLVMWSVLSPLLPHPQTTGGCVTPDNRTCIGSSVGVSDEDLSREQDMYSFLHTTLMEALVAHTSIKTSTSTYTYPVDISVFSSVGNMVNSVVEHHWDVASAKGEAEQMVEEAVNRLAQILQVSLSHNLLVSPSMGDARDLVNQLPENKLLSLVLAHYVH
jgi:hypothetical protein